MCSITISCCSASPIAFLAADGLKRGFLSWEKTLLALAWIAPLFARQLAAATLIPLGQATAIIVLALAARRAALLDGAFRPAFARPSLPVGFAR